MEPVDGLMSALEPSCGIKDQDHKGNRTQDLLKITHMEMNLVFIYLFYLKYFINIF